MPVSNTMMPARQLAVASPVYFDDAKIARYNQLRGGIDPSLLHDTRVQILHALRKRPAKSVCISIWTA
jgi:hypothetical protein